MTKSIFILATSIALWFSSSASAYYAVLDNGEVLQPGRYKVTGDAQVLTENGGLNLGGRFDMGFDEEFGLRGLVGFGKTDFFLGGMFKWMPIPDIENQPAMGVNLGFLYGKDGDVRDTTLRAEPMLSKKIDLQGPVLTPYVSLPIGFRMRNTDNPDIDDDNEYTFQLVLGSQLQIEKWKNLQFMAEIGLDLDKAPGYIAVAGVFYFDSESGMALE